MSSFRQGYFPFTKGEVASFPWTILVYLYNQWERAVNLLWGNMSTTALPPAPASKLNCAFQRELYDWFQIVSFVLYVAFTLQCYTLLYLSIFHAISSCIFSGVSCEATWYLRCSVAQVCALIGLYFDIKYLDVQYMHMRRVHVHLIQNGNCFAVNIRDTPPNYNTAFHVFPCILLPHGFINIIIFSMTR